MFQINLSTLAMHWPIIHTQQGTAAPRPRTAYLRRALDVLGNLATARIMAGTASGTARQSDPRDPSNW